MPTGFMSELPSVVHLNLRIAELERAGRAPQYNQRVVAQALFRAKHRVDIMSLITATMSQIAANRSASPGAPGGRNWRTEPQLRIGSRNQWGEVFLARKIASTGRYCNHIPVCSGYCRAENRRGQGAQHAIDLASCDRKAKACTLIELKWDANSPLFAAIEILQYYCANLYTRLHRKELRQDTVNPWLDSECVELWVLAPRLYYRGYDVSGLRAFEHQVNEGLRVTTGHPKWPKCVSFHFKHLPFDEKAYLKAPKEQQDKILRDALDNIADL